MSDYLTHEEDLIYRLETLSSYEPEDLGYPEFEVAYEDNNGNEGFLNVCCVNLAQEVLELIKVLKTKGE